MIPHASVTACTLRSAPGRTSEGPRGAGLGESVAAVGGTDPSPRHTTRWGEPRAPGTDPRLRLPPQVPRHPGLSQRQLLFTGPIVSKGSLVLSLLADAELSTATAVTATLQRSSKRDTDQPESRRPLSLGARSPRQKARSCSQTAPVARMVLCRPVPMIYLRLRTDATGACGTRDNRRNPV